jgi:hypothetical protein
MNIFGFEIRRKNEKPIESVVTPANDDGTSIVSTGASYYGMTLNLDTKVTNENDMIKRYREISGMLEVDSAIDDIVNEAIVIDGDSPAVTLNMDNLEMPERIKKLIRENFDEVLSVMKFDEKGYDYFRNWYIDGRIYFQILIDENKLAEGIKELRWIDPVKIKKVKEIIKDRNKQNGTEVVKEVKEYFVYNEKGINNTTQNGVKLSKDSILYCPSGIVDYNGGMVISHLNKVIKTVNQLRMVEDSMVIYRISRAPERRIFYIDVGNLPKAKAEQYIRDIMNKYRNKLVYDVNTGEMRDDRKHLSMMEDFWMPRREGGKGTEITTLPGGQNLGDIADIEYFKQKLYQGLNVPLGRLTPNQNFSLGRSNEITRDEIKFSKFVNRLRQKFSSVFADALKTQLILKKVIRPEEWDDIAKDIRFEYNVDNHFTEMKESEIMGIRVNMLQQLDNYVGRYYSKEWIRKNVLRQTDEDIDVIDQQIEDEKDDPDMLAKNNMGQNPPDEQPNDGEIIPPPKTAKSKGDDEDGGN